MPSHSLGHWQNESAKKLDEIEAAHAAIGGTGRGRRYATQQLNQSYVLLISSHFQQFCRGLHSEAIEHLLVSVAPQLLPIVQAELARGRKIDQGNPNPGNIGADFGRLGMTFWNDVNKLSPRNVRRQKQLEQMNVWRNAIAHQDFTGNADKLGNRSELRINEARSFRKACAGLAPYFDRAVLAHIKAVAGSSSEW